MNSLKNKYLWVVWSHARAPFFYKKKNSTSNIVSNLLGSVENYQFYFLFILNSYSHSIIHLG